MFSVRCGERRPAGVRLECGRQPAQRSVRTRGAHPRRGRFRGDGGIRARSTPSARVRIPHRRQPGGHRIRFATSLFFTNITFLFTYITTLFTSITIFFTLTMISFHPHTIHASNLPQGMFATALRTLSESLDNLPDQLRTKVAILCYDAALHFFALPVRPSRLVGPTSTHYKIY